jgi:hypothetical protein
VRRLLILALLLAPGGAEARRMPTVGGEVRVGLPEALVEAATEAAGTTPLLSPPSPDDPPWIARGAPPLPGTDLRSARVVALEAEDGGRAWRVIGADLTEPLQRCLVDGPAWPAAALRAAGVTASVAPRSDGALLRFSATVGALPELLTGCPVPDPAGFQPAEGGLERAAGVGVHRLRFVGPDAPSDLREEPGGAPGRTLVVAPIDSVALLVQGPRARAEDPFGAGSGAAGLDAFAERLRPGLMAEVLAGGRAEAARGVLPPGLAPPRPQAGGEDPGSAAVARPERAPTITLDRGDGELLGGLADRLLALLAARGGAPRPAAPPEAWLVRWGPPSRDPALSLLALAAEHPDLHTPGLRDPRLLDADPTRRLEAALDLERGWIEDRRVIPLLAARRWMAVHEDLHGVRLRADGVPLFDRAWWRVP